MTIQIEEGKCYVTNTGARVGPMQLHARKLFHDASTTMRVWWSDGTRYSGVMRDTIVAEALEPSVEPPGSAQEMLNAAFVADDIARDTAQQKDEPGRKMDGGKPRVDLIAPEMIFGVSEILTFGAAKYSERNWETGMSWGRCFGAGMRHLWAWWAGEKNDRETGKPHLWHAACCIMFLIAYEARGAGTDDRAKAANRR